ncbi:MAG: hypothetical protein R3190_08420, partial [Thermoanaerobaculia bacterium]|nr:hypothetical protein [Thermoanaerobaculia bacterium]
MNDNKIRTGRLTLKPLVLVAIIAAAGAAVPAIAQDDANPYLAACTLFGGTYEERRTGCDPDCVVTFICSFADGTGRQCTEADGCSPLKAAA